MAEEAYLSLFAMKLIQQACRAFLIHCDLDGVLLESPEGFGACQPSGQFGWRRTQERNARTQSIMAVIRQSWLNLVRALMFREALSTNQFDLQLKDTV